MTKRKKDKPNRCDLRIWWIPQIPGKQFFVPVKSVDEAILIYDTLGRYDEFQFKENIKPDYSNVGGLQVYDWDADGDGQHDWIDWHDEDTDEDFDDILREREDEANAR